MSDFSQGYFFGALVMVAYFWAKDWYASHGRSHPSEPAFFVACAVAFMFGIVRGAIQALGA